MVAPNERGPELFNGGQHIFIDIEPNKNQTLSCRLPNGKVVTFAFVPAGNSIKSSNEIECVDIHSNVGPELPRPDKTGNFNRHHLIGFTVGGTAFDTRRVESANPKHVTSMATLLLRTGHYHTAEERPET